MKKLLTYIISIVVLLVGIYVFVEKNSTKNKLLAYINNKYDDKFVFYAPFGGGIGPKYRQMLVKSEKYPDDEIWVAYYEDGFFSDNYIDYKFEKQTEEFLPKYLSQIFECDTKVIYSVAKKGRRNSFNEETLFEDYLKSSESNIGISVAVEPSFRKKDEIIEVLKERLCEDNIISFASIYFAESKEQYEDFNGTVEEVKYIVFSKNMENGSCICEWR